MRYFNVQIMEYVTTVMRQKFTNNPCVSSEISFTSDADILNRITTRLGMFSITIMLLFLVPILRTIRRTVIKRNDF